MGPATDKHQAPNHRLRLYVGAVIESDARQDLTFLTCSVINMPPFESINIVRHARNKTVPEFL